jgi:leader peptidase (prepilin peptidase)/N-methyltransferase
MGSFFNVVISRLPNKESLLYPPSHCSNCGYSIPPWKNIPVISYIMLRGRCSKCGTKIHWHHLLVEIVTPILFVAIHLRYGFGTVIFFKYLILTGFLIPIFFIDAFHQLILHVTSIPLIVIGLGFALVPGNDIGIMNSLITAGISFSLLLAMAWLFTKIKKREGLGGGDLWLITGLGASLGALALPWILLLGSLLGILYFFVVVRSKEQVFAFGPFIVVGTMIWILGFDRLVLPLMYP